MHTQIICRKILVVNYSCVNYSATCLAELLYCHKACHLECLIKAGYTVFLSTHVPLSSNNFVVKFGLLFNRWIVGLIVAVVSLFLSSLITALYSQRHHTPVPVTIYELKEGVDGLWVEKHSTCIEEHVFYLRVQVPLTWMLIGWRMCPYFRLDERRQHLFNLRALTFISGGSADILVFYLTIWGNAGGCLHFLKTRLENRISEAHGMLVHFLDAVLFPERASTKPPVKFLCSIQPLFLPSFFWHWVHAANVLQNSFLQTLN